MTTVGFGDITPHTDLGKLISSAMMLMGWGTLAVPTGIVTAEFAHRRNQEFVAKKNLRCLLYRRSRNNESILQALRYSFSDPEN
jgi:voltage-gated potassium channel